MHGRKNIKILRVVIQVPSELQCLSTLPARICGWSSDKYSGFLKLEDILMYVTS